MLDRARHFTSSYLHDEKLVSLGKLAAGLAHELNNPASAIARSAGALATSVFRADAASRALGSVAFTAEQIAAIEKVRDACVAGHATSVLSPLEQEDREDSLRTWLEQHHADTSAAEALAETSVTIHQLDQLADSVEGPVLNTAVGWLAAGCTTRRLTSEIQEAASRIHHLVSAIKGFTQMDREAVPEPVGQFLLTARTPISREMIGIIDWRMAQCADKGVEFHLNTFAEADEVTAE